MSSIATLLDCCEDKLWLLVSEIEVVLPSQNFMDLCFETFDLILYLLTNGFYWK